MPDALELPRPGRAVVPLVRARHAGVGKAVANRVPRLAAIVRALDLLPEPAGALRRVQPIRIDRRAFEVIHLPTTEQRTLYVPLLALAIGGQDERALARTDEKAYLAHVCVCLCTWCSTDVLEGQ